MPDIKIKDAYGEEQTFNGINKLIVRNADGSGTTEFSVGGGGTPSIYKFYDADGVELTEHTVAGLATAVTYTKNGGEELPIGGTGDRIFFIDNEAVENDDDKFYIVHNEIVENKYWWEANDFNTTFNATQDGIGRGKINTKTILRIAQEKGITWGENDIWTYLASVNSGTINDWYIPSMTEQALLKNSGIVTWFQDYFPWTSVEKLDAPDYGAYFWTRDEGYWFYSGKAGIGGCFVIRSI